MAFVFRGARPFDVHVEGSKIVARAEDARVLDCRGLAVAPGFIDAHSHSDLRVLAEPALPMKVRQGITTEVFGQDGLSVAPVIAKDVAARRRQLAGLDGDPLPQWPWTGVGEYLDAVRKAKPAVDVAYLIPHGAVRQCAMGMDDRAPTPAELREMERLTRTGMEEGAVGMSTGLIYPPCCYAKTDELIALARVVAKFDGVFVAHIRNEGDFIVPALEELIRVGRESGCRIHVSHLKIAGRDNWPKLEQVLRLLEGARKDVEISADQYPYVAGSTMMGAILPPWAHSGGPDAAVRRLSDPVERARMREQILDPRPAEWDNFWRWSGAEGIVISDIASGNHPGLLGRTLAQAAGKREPLDFALDLLRDEKLGVSMVSFSQCEEVVEAFLRLPYVGVCTDGLLGGRPHPRAYGTYPRILGRYVRDRKVLSLEAALCKMSAVSARAYRLKGMGAVEPGARANLVAFDPERVTDLATFENPCQFPEGIVYVMHGGELVYDATASA
ncbi:MAG: D-aminoacylase [Planctomycetes bacterium]|nr:D-aminoacylase [Planctomycetota bacterium]